MKQTLLDQVAWIGDKSLRGPVRGIVLRFQGLGAAAMKSDPDALELEWGNAGALVVAPYHGPWAWMNHQTRAFVHEVVEGLLERYELGPETPILSTGGSMGGHGALLYTRYAIRPVTACMALFPVCDLPYHYTERADLPRTMHHAFGSYDDITDLLELNSPLHQAGGMPDIPYLFVHGDADKAVNKEHHSDRMVRALTEQKCRVEYMEVPGMGHGGPKTWEVERRMADFVLENLVGGAKT